MRRISYIFILFSLISLAGFGFLFFSNANKTEANKHEFWVTMDHNELQIVQNELPDFKFNVKSVQNGIAVVHISNGEVERLSTEMHKHFHKCSGFFAHDTEIDALNSVAKTNSIDGNQRLVDYTIDNASNVTPLIPQTQEIRVRQMILDLSSYDNRRYNQPEGLQSAQFIKDTWTTIANGRSDISVEFFNHPDTISPQPSIILTIQGTTTPDEIVILGGHQDSIRSGSQTGLAPGADDNASGIASLTEAIRVIVEKGFRPARTVKFMAYAAEEVGLRGSKEIAQNFNTNNQNVIGVLQFDMTNFQGNADFDFAFESDSRFINVPQTQFMKNLVDTYLPDMQYTDSRCNYGCSDHASWHNEGFPASFPFEAPFGQHNSTIHSGNDSISQSNNMATHAEKFTKLGLTFLGELAKGEIQTVAPANKTRLDFDGDSKTDVSIFRPDVGQWWYLKSSDGGNNAFQFGNADDKLIPADYTGDGKTDIAFWRESTTEVYVLRSEDATFYAIPFGTAGDIHAPGDFDGDGIDDVAVYRPSNSTWYINRSSDATTAIIGFGVAEDKPIVADYDGDGRDDIAVYRPSVSEWWINRSTDGVIAYQFGSTGDKTIQGDYTGDGKADIGFWRESTGEWFVIRSEDNSFFAFPFGSAGDIPTPGDYDGDGKMDAAVFRPTENIWYKQQSQNGFEAIGFGSAGDIPLPNNFVVE
jgi:leucyl aminopeptidase